MSQGSTENVSATVRRWQLAERLRQYREAAGMTNEKATEELRKGPGRWSRSKLSRIENREHNLKLTELERMLDVYGVTDRDARRELHEIAAKAGERGWWLAYRSGVPAQIHPFLDLESAMLEMREFAMMLVPGLLQTPDYARALINGVSPHLGPDQVELMVSGRMARQQIMARQNPPKLHVILHQALLEQLIGSPSVARTQFLRLAEIAEMPNVTIQVLPKSIGANPGIEGPFGIFALPEPVPDIGYTEGPGGSIYVEDRDQVRQLIIRFGTLTQVALPAGDSLHLINEAARSYEE